MALARTCHNRTQKKRKAKPARHPGGSGPQTPYFSWFDTASNVLVNLVGAGDQGGDEALLDRGSSRLISGKTGEKRRLLSLPFYRYTGRFREGTMPAG